MTERPADPRRARDLAYGAHTFLAASMAGWRALEATPGLAGDRGGGVLGAPVGRALAAGLLLAGVVALGVALVSSIADVRGRRGAEPGLLLLAASLAAALAQRRAFDVFDLAYVLAAALLALWWFAERRYAVRRA